MDPSNTLHTSDTLQLIHRIKQEIDDLSAQQNDALKSATYLGMTPEEARQYDARRERITNLVKQFELLQNAQ